MPQITVAAVRGWCLGGGLALINGHDLCIAGQSAKFGMPEVIRGSYGAVATLDAVSRRIPVKKAFYIQLTGRNLSAAEAERVGLISEVVPDDQLLANVEQLSKELGSRNAVTLGERQDRRVHDEGHGLCDRAQDRRLGFAPDALLHQSAQRRRRLSALAKGRRHRQVCQTGGSEEIIVRSRVQGSKVQG